MTRQLRFREIVGKRVVAADGRALGRVADLAAERRGDALRVTALLVGPGALIRRIGFRRLGPASARRPQRVPWGLVAAVGETVRLRVPGDDPALRDADHGDGDDDGEGGR